MPTAKVGNEEFPAKTQRRKGYEVLSEVRVLSLRLCVFAGKYLLR